MTSDLGAVFAQAGWLSLSPADFRAALLAQCRTIKLVSGQAVFREGDPGGGIYGVVSGGVGVMVGPPLMPPRLGHILSPGAWFGGGPELRGGARTLEFEAVTPSCLVNTPKHVIEALAGCHPDTVRRIGGLASQGVDLATRIVAELMIADSLRRVAAVLVRLAAPSRSDGVGFPDGIPVNQTKLAEMCNVSRNLASIALRRFRAEEWLTTRYNKLLVRNVGALKAFAYAEHRHKLGSA